MSVPAETLPVESARDRREDGRRLRLLLMLDETDEDGGLEERLRWERFAGALVLPATVRQAAAMARACDAIVLEGDFEGRDAVSVCRDLRARAVSTPIVMLAARPSPEHRAAALDAGVDDYLVSSVTFPELRARIQALSRRPGGSERSDVLRVADLTLDLLRHRVTRGGRAITLTRTEHAILEVLMRHAGELVTRETLHEELWGKGTGPIPPPANRLDVHLSNLRRKIARPGESPLIRTVWGCGYRMDDDDGGSARAVTRSSPDPGAAIPGGRSSVEMA